MISFEAKEKTNCAQKSSCIYVSGNPGTVQSAVSPNFTDVIDSSSSRTIAFSVKLFQFRAFRYWFDVNISALPAGSNPELIDLAADMLYGIGDIPRKCGELGFNP